MKSLTKIMLIILSFGVASCVDNLNVAPVDRIDANNSLKTSADIEALVVGAYDALGDGDLLGGNMLRDAELIGDDGDVFWDGTFVAPGEIWTKNMQITNDQAEATWLDGYRTINICNTVLSNLDKVADANKDRVEGDAKFVRGLMYFELVKSYAKTYTDGSPATNLGIPLVTAPTTIDNLNETKNVIRNSVEEVYQQIEDDLLDAVNLLPEDNGFFANTYVASAILSRVYLMKNDYAAAALAADRVIQSGLFELLPAYSSNFNRSSAGVGANTTSEDVFSVQVTNQDGVNNMNTFFASSDYSGRGDIYIEQAHFDRYEPGDDRLNLFYDDERTGKWNNQFGNVNIVRLAEMYLTRAEANLETGGVPIGDTPLNDINLIRDRVGLTALSSVTIDDVLNERRLELAFEGHLIHDLKRRQKPVGSLAFSADKLVFPIPNREIMINSKLEQNPGYGN